MDAATDRLSEEARAFVDDVLQRTPPLYASATCEEVAQYLSYARDALAALRPWQADVTDQLETVALLRVLVRLHELHLFDVASDDGDPSLWSLLSDYRTSADRVAAALACTLFERLCAQRAHGGRAHQSDVKAWIARTTAAMPRAVPSPSSSGPKRMRVDDAP